MSDGIIGIIPARYASTRFPGKPLADIDGKSMIQRVYERASQALSAVYVATDDQRIFDHVSSFGNAIMTSADTASGTDRCLEAIQFIDDPFDYIINIQGDEPFINPDDITKVANSLKKSEGQIQLATLFVPLTSEERIKDPNTVKLVIDQNNQALYFSRSPIPYKRTAHPVTFLQHIGLYGYRKDILETICKLPPSDLEQTESLEQLRWLEAGLKINTIQASSESLGIDTPEDLKEALENKLWQAN